MSFIILDRDGVINYDSQAYIKSPEEWQAIPGSLEAIAALNQAGFKVVIATNQSGIARGLYDTSVLARIHAKLKRELACFKGVIQEFFFCPHHPEDKCWCRKPNPGLLQQIGKKYCLSLSDTFFIGDSYSDVKAAELAGCKPILVLTGNGHDNKQRYSALETVLHFEDLAKAVAYILAHEDNHHNVQ